MSGIFENLGIDSGIIIIILLILVVFLLVRSISYNMRLSRLERRYKIFMKGSDAQSLEKVFVRKFAQIDRLYEAKEDHDHDILFLKKIWKKCSTNMVLRNMMLLTTWEANSVLLLHYWIRKIQD